MAYAKFKATNSPTSTSPTLVQIMFSKVASVDFSTLITLRSVREVSCLITLAISHNKTGDNFADILILMSLHFSKAALLHF